MEDLLSLAVGKLDIKHPAVRFYDRQGVEFSLGRPIDERIEVPQSICICLPGAD